MLITRRRLRRRGKHAMLVCIVDAGPDHAAPPAGSAAGKARQAPHHVDNEPLMDGGGGTVHPANAGLLGDHIRGEDFKTAGGKGAWSGIAL